MTVHMRTLQEIQNAIKQLPPVSRAGLEKWFYLSVFPADSSADEDRLQEGVAEPTAAYKLTAERHFLSADEYLKCEENSPTKHEYVAGEIFAMAGGSLRHNVISLNLATACRSSLRGSPCEVFMADVRLHIHDGRQEFFYYPDVMVACGLQNTEGRDVENPKLLIEVLSRHTERTDRGEKSLNYRGIATLEEYVLVAQDRVEVTVQRRNEDWEPVVFTDPEAAVELVSIGLSLPLEEVYARAL